MKILEQSQVSPPSGSVPESSLPLTFFDAIRLDAGPIRRCLFFDFPHSTAEFISSRLPNLKSALSLTLQNFFPLAGKIRLSPNSDTLSEIHYSTDDSITLTVSETELNFLDLVGCQLHDSNMLDPLVPELIDSGSGRPLLAIQLTVFPNQGVAIATTSSHVVCDGRSLTHFTKSWAAACSSVSSALPLPSFDRNGLVSKFHDFYRLCVKPEKSNKNLEVDTATDGSVTAIFNFTTKNIQDLKTWVKAKAQNPSLYCSTYVVTSAYLWVCMAKLRNYAADKTVYFRITADYRHRLKPPVPGAYFGNCTFFSFVEMRAGDLMKDDGVVAASEGIGKVIGEFDGDIVKIIERSMETSRNAMANGSLFSIAGSPKFGIYDIDFGWGRLVRTEICLKNGGMLMVDSRVEEGSVEISVALQREEMERFSDFFAQGLQSI